MAPPDCRRRLRPNGSGPEPDGGDAGLADAGREEDAGASCVLTPPAELLTFGPRIAVPLENPKLLDGVMTPAGRVFAILDPMNTRVLLVGPTWQRELVESTPELARVHLAFNGAQFAVTWQAGQRLRFALFDVQGNPQHHADDHHAGRRGGGGLRGRDVGARVDPRARDDRRRVGDAH